MLDFFLRACQHPLDYCKILKSHRLNFKAKHDLGNDCYEFKFSCDSPINWLPGQHGVFTLSGKKVAGKKWRAFSVTSTPSQNEIAFATSIPPKSSDFKLKLMNLQLGDEVVMYGPLGEFHLNKNIKTAIGIAGGIGITPFISVLSDVADGQYPDTVFKLIYAGKNNIFAFKKILDQYENHPNIHIKYVNTPDEVNSAIDIAVAEYGNDATYLISGSPGMIGAIRDSLKQKNISKIINDPFKGY